MLETSSNGATVPVARFVQRNTEEALPELHRPIDPRHFKARKQGSITLTHVPWATVAKHLHPHALGGRRHWPVLAWSNGDQILSNRQGRAHYAKCDKKAKASQLRDRQTPLLNTILEVFRSQ